MINELIKPLINTLIPDIYGAATLNKGGRVNLIEFPSDFDIAYWEPYWEKPTITEGHPDPFGGNTASRFSSLDGGPESFSGILVAGALPFGIYTVGAWVRVLTGTTAFQIGVNDQNRSEVIATTEWQWLHGTFNVQEDGGNPRLFQIFENIPANSEWEMVGVSCEAGTRTTPFYPASGGGVPTRGPELIANGTFDSDISGWTSNPDNDPAQIVKSWEAPGRLKMVRGSGGNSNGPTQSVPVEVGALYELKVTGIGMSVAARVDSGQLETMVVGVGSKVYQFTATQPSIAPYFWNTNTNSIAYIDDVSLRKVLAP